MLRIFEGLINDFEDPLVINFTKVTTVKKQKNKTKKKNKKNIP